MCGIYCILSRRSNAEVPPEATHLLQHRGPDSIERVTVPIRVGDNVLYLTCVSSVLSLRGAALTPQPLQDTLSGNLLCWNGEAWEVEGARIEGNDGQLVLGRLNEATATSLSDSQAHGMVLQLLSSIRGPHAFVFFDAARSRLYFARDCLGRRSLLKTSNTESDLILSSVSHTVSGTRWAEVEADRLHMIVVAAQVGQEEQQDIIWNIKHVPYVYPHSGGPSNTLVQTLPFAPINKVLPEASSLNNEFDTEAVTSLQALLTESIKVRVTNIRDPSASSAIPHVAVLYSGGLDCTLLVRLAHDILPPTEPIDLVNVAFENPRIHKDPSVNAYELCPDRMTARSSLAELRQVCVDRKLRLICVNVPFTETTAHRQTIVDLMHPHNTEMDFSIACALYFASRGIGFDSISNEPCTIKARVLLSGLGADELFGGYQRHAIAFNRLGHQGLIDELELDFTRLGKRNLGRDDRVLSHWGKEARYPYLDEKVVEWALQAPVWLKTSFGKEQREGELEPGKRVLREMALKLGLPGVAREAKRAIQFGSRTAKMTSGKTKGTTLLS